VDAAVAGCACGPGYGDGDEEGCEPDWENGLVLSAHGEGLDDRETYQAQ
jgi:hypothetical protein